MVLIICPAVAQAPPPFTPGTVQLNSSAPPLALPVHDGGHTIVPATAVLEDSSAVGEDAMQQDGDTSFEMSNRHCSRGSRVATATLVVALILGLFIDAAFHRCTPLAAARASSSPAIWTTSCVRRMGSAMLVVPWGAEHAGWCAGGDIASKTLPSCDCSPGWEGKYCESCGPSEIYEGEPFGDLGCWNIDDRAEVLGAEGTVQHSTSGSFLPACLMTKRNPLVS